MAYEIRIRLIITDDEGTGFNNEKVTEALDLGVPDNTWHKGDIVNDRVKRRRPNSALVYRLFTGRDCDPMAELARLIEMLEQKGPAAKNLLRNYYTEFSIVIRFYAEADDAQDVPSIHFSSALIEKLHDLGIEVGFDLYLMGAAWDPVK